MAWPKDKPAPPQRPTCCRVYASLTRLQHHRWISASWGASENNRKAKFYAITTAGRRQLVRETENWERVASVIARLLRTANES